jgi:hypothetical protein
MAMSEAATLTPQLLFRPDAIFLKPWRGWGVMRDLRGRPVLRYEAAGQGRAMSRGAIAEQVFTFENGQVQRVTWEILSDDETHFFARDLVSGVVARGRQRGKDFTWAFTSKAPTPVGSQKVRAEVLYTQVSEATAFSFTRTTLWGLQLATYTTFYEQR